MALLDAIVVSTYVDPAPRVVDRTIPPCHRAATSHASRLLALPPPPDAAAATAAAKEARGLVGDIQRRGAEVKRSNKRLAKELSAWVSVAMHASNQSDALGGVTPPPSPPHDGDEAEEEVPIPAWARWEAQAPSLGLGTRGFMLVGLFAAVYIATVVYHAP